MATERAYVPFGEWLPDKGFLANGGLRVADGVVPVHGDYICHPQTSAIQPFSLAANEAIVGLAVASYNGNGYALIQNTVAPYADIVEATDAAAITNRTRTAAHNYNGACNFIDGCSFGDSVVCTVFSTTTPSSSEPVQYLVAGAARFANMITSTFEPRAKFAFPFRGNLFLANCYVPVAFDTLTVKHYPRLVAWSQTDNIRAFGSYGVTPALTGTGYQELNFDIGDIVDAVSGNDYAIIAMTNGLVRVDGPPYTFRVLARGNGCIAPNAITIAGSDVFWMGPAGLCRLRGGEGEPETVGVSKFARWLMDTSTVNVGQPFARPLDSTAPMSLTYDSVNDLLLLVYKQIAAANETTFLWYNVREDRASSAMVVPAGYVSFVQARPQTTTANWAPGRDFRFILGGVSYASFAYSSSGFIEAEVNLRRGLLQIKPDATTRIMRVRPVYFSQQVNLHPYLTVTVVSYADPNSAGTATAPSGTFDAHGWIVLPDSKYGDFHDIRLRMVQSALGANLREYEGLEYEIETGGAYSA